MVKSTRLMKTILILFTAWCFILTLYSLRELIEETVREQNWFWMTLAIIVFVLILVAALLLISKMMSHISGKYRTAIIAAIIFVLALASRAIFYMIIATPQFSDFNTFYKVTVRLSLGDNSFIGHNYWQAFSYQLGFPLFMSMFARLFHIYTQAPLIFINSIFASGSVVFIYLIAKRHVKEYAAIFAALIFLFFPLPLDLSAVFTNQHLSMLFILMGLYELGGKWPPPLPKAIFGGIMLSLGNIIRPDAVIFTAAIAVLALLCIRKDLIKPSGIRIRRILLVTGIIVIAFIFLGSLIGQICSWKGVQPNGFSNSFPLYKFAVGSNYSTGGRYSRADDNFLIRNDAFFKDKTVRNKETAVLIKKRLSIGTGKLINLADMKVRFLWTTYKNDYASFHGVYSKIKTNSKLTRSQVNIINSWAKPYDNLLGFILFAVSGVAGIILFRRKRLPAVIMVLVLSFLAFSSLHMLIEVQYRYHYIMLPVLLIISTFAIEKIRKT
ncbi:MAG: glycosyltransferase family 39 protein [Clostridia bacterium]|jgi:hypothetical protein